MCRLFPLAVLVSIAAVLCAEAGELPKAEPGAVKLSAEKLAKLNPALQKLVDDGKVAGGVAVVARHGKMAHVTTFGYRDLASQSPMTEDTIFAIASMTKPITCVAVMTLVEQGKIGLDDPVARYLPEFNDVRVLGDAKDDTAAEFATVAAKRPVTIRDLLSHTSGISYGLMAGADRLGQAYAKAGIGDQAFKKIAEMVERLAKAPLAHQPGEGWTYGYSHDVLGRLIEVVSGESLDAYLQERILAPLDMRDTFFNVPESKRARVATIYRAEAGKLTALTTRYGSPTFFSGGGGLYSTARDYTRFSQMLLNKGELGGVRILKPEMIAEMTTNQIGKHTSLGGTKYGLGFGLLFEPPGGDGKAVLNRYFWYGLFSTNFWIEPRHEVVAVIMTQLLPPNHVGTDVIFRTIVDEAIEK
jgi:CubicO group peptidase (beta-lactamase class C family)